MALEKSEFRVTFMPAYENADFGIQIEFPEKWKLVSWKHGSVGRSSRSAYQSRDDELPTKGPQASRFLFTACLHPPESEAMVEADIEFSVFRLAEGEDLRQTLLQNCQRRSAQYQSGGIASSIFTEGTWTLGNVDFGYVDEHSKREGGQSRYRFFFRRMEGILWFYGKIAGHRDAAFAEALQIVEALKYDPSRIR